jgi:hypothetical protein
MALATKRRPERDLEAIGRNGSGKALVALALMAMRAAARSRSQLRLCGYRYDCQLALSRSVAPKDAIRARRVVLRVGFKHLRVCLDAARFIEAHARGRRFNLYEGESWEILPLARDLEAHPYGGLDGDKRMKSEITSGLRGAIARAEVPRGARLGNVRTKEIVAREGPIFVQIERCHLSSGLGTEIIHLEIIEDAPMRHDVASEFSLLASFWPATAISQLLDKGDLTSSYRRQNLFVPGRWITATLEELDGDKYPPTLQWVEVTRWAD